jgi:hypothetical protein
MGMCGAVLQLRGLVVVLIMRRVVHTCGHIS